MILLAVLASFAPGPVPEAVRQERWEEVRSYTARIANPTSPALALAVARAHRKTGDPERALQVARSAMTDAGELAAALRLEAAAATVDLGRDPWPMVQPLLARGAPAAHRRAAIELLQGSWPHLPIDTLRRTRQRSLPAPVKRRLEALLAARAGDGALARQLLAANDSDAVATDLCMWLTSRPEGGEFDPLACGNALLVGGRWREARALLTAAAVPEQPEHLFRYHFLMGRAAYRLGLRQEAGVRFERAVAAAGNHDDLFAAAVQRARVAELERDGDGALHFWHTARTARPARWEGWDGEARTLVRLDRTTRALALLDETPPRARSEVAARLAAVLLARGRLVEAAVAVGHLQASSPERALLVLAARVRQGESDLHEETAALLADRRAGRWRELVAGLPRPVSAPDRPVPGTRNLQEVAGIAAVNGLETARDSLLRALAGDPAWARLVAGVVEPPEPLDEVIRALGAVGLEREAARLYPHRFPNGTPAELAWSARALAAWGNAPAALTRGERLWEALGPFPAALLPDVLLPLILPDELVAAVKAASVGHAVPASLVAAVVRQESRFETAARSRAGALGIAQVMPETAQSLGADPSQLLDVGTSLALAARELARLRLALGDPALLAVGGYNAGEAIVRSWLDNLDGSRDELLFALLVPYRETSGYILAVREGMELARHLR